MKRDLVNIHPEAELHETVTVEPFTTIYHDVTVGEGTWIGPNVTIMPGARIGKHCKIYPGAVVSGDPQDLKYDGEKTETFIGDNTTIRECVTVSRGTADKWKTVIGSNCLLMAYVHIAHDCFIHDNCILSNAVQVAGHVEIMDHVIIGGSSAVHQFVKIGAHAFLGGGSLARKDVPPYIKAVREPLAFGGINSVGLKRRGFSSEQTAEIHEIYRRIYMQGQNTVEALERIEAEIPPSEARDTVIDFIRNSTRGIIRGYSL